MKCVLSIASQKGGVGKTTVALNLAYSMSLRGWRVLLIDSDPQGGIGHSIKTPDKKIIGLANIVMKNVWHKRSILKTRIQELHIMLTGNLVTFDSSSFGAKLFNNRTFEAIRNKVKNDYDLIIIDTPPGFGSGSLAALRASNFVLSPIQAEPCALRTLPQFLEAVSYIRSKGFPLKIAGVLLTMVQYHDEYSMEVVKKAWSALPGDLILNTMIPRDSAFLKATAEGVALGLLRGEKDAVSTIFDQLAIEIEPRLNIKKEEHHDCTSLFN